MEITKDSAGTGPRLHRTISKERFSNRPKNGHSFFNSVVPHGAGPTGAATGRQGTTGKAVASPGQLVAGGGFLMPEQLASVRSNSSSLTGSIL
jgi:hypothetical protein